MGHMGALFFFSLGETNDAKMAGGVKQEKPKWQA